MSVKIYTQPNCGYCHSAKSLLGGKGIPYEEINAAASEQARHEMITRSGGRTSTPQIFIGDQHVGGADDLFTLERTGELDRLLAANSACLSTQAAA